MSGFSPGRTGLAPERSDMTQADVANPLDVLRDAVRAERLRTGSVKSAIAAIARLMAMTPRRVEAIWWGEPVRLDWEEATRIRAVAAQQWRREVAEAEARAALLKARLAALREGGADGLLVPDVARVAPVSARTAAEGKG